MGNRDTGERLAVVEVRQEVADDKIEALARTVERMANNVVAMQGEANADRELMRETLRVIAATHAKIERVVETVQRSTRAQEEIAAQLQTAIPEIRLRAGDAATEARRAADATGRVQLAAPAERTGPVKAIVRTIFRAPAAKILAVAALVIALGIAAGAMVAVYQEMHALKARLGGHP